MVGWLLNIAGALGVVSGILMLLTRCRHPSVEEEASQTAIQKLLQANLSKPHYIDRHVYRHHRIIGLILVLASTSWLWLLLPMPAWRKLLGLTYRYIKALNQSELIGIVLATLLAVSILVIGLLMLVRPSLLKPLESLAHRSVMTPSKRDVLPRNDALGGFSTSTHRRMAGLILLCAGVACLYSAAQL